MKVAQIKALFDKVPDDTQVFVVGDDSKKRLVINAKLSFLMDLDGAKKNNESAQVLLYGEVPLLGIAKKN